MKRPTRTRRTGGLEQAEKGKETRVMRIPRSDGGMFFCLLIVVVMGFRAKLRACYFVAKSGT